MEGPYKVMLTGVTLLIVAILIYLFLRNESLDTGIGWLLMSIAIIVIFIGVMWYVARREEKAEKAAKAEGKEAR